MSLTFRNNSPKKFGHYALAPFRLVGRTYLLADDFVYRRVDEVARATELATTKLTRGKYVVTREKLAYTSLFGMPTAGCLLDKHLGSWAPVLAICAYVLLRLGFFPTLKKIFDNETGTGASIAINPIKTIPTIARFPLLLFATYDIFIRPSISSVSYTLGLSISFYLASGSNGMIERANNSLYNIMRRAREAVGRGKDKIGDLLPDGNPLPNPATSFQVTGQKPSLAN